MKKLAMTAIAASLAFSLPVFADDAHHPEKAAAATNVPAPRVGKMQENVKKMQSSWSYRQGQDAGERQEDAENQHAMRRNDRQGGKTMGRRAAEGQGMAEHMRTMQERNMQMMAGPRHAAPAGI
jgi:hypothetical protein